MDASTRMIPILSIGLNLTALTGSVEAVSLNVDGKAVVRLVARRVQPDSSGQPGCVRQ